MGINKKHKIIYAHIINPISDNKCQFIKDGALVLSKKNNSNDYTIEGIYKSSSRFIETFTDVEEVNLKSHVIIPAFFDMHFHWVQDNVREKPKADLLHWLEHYTFPEENKFKNKKYSEKKAKSFFKKLLQNGTLGGACYSSVHEHALEHAMQFVQGDFIIGNVLMTQNSPDYLLQDSKEAISMVQRLAKKYKSKYALTPRFAIATDPITMKKTAAIAKKYDCFMQSHLSETRGEIQFVLEIYNQLKEFKKTKTYTDIYKKVDMLGSKTIMGHGIHLQESELKILSKTKTAIAHCPTSNAPVSERGLGSGLFNFKKLDKYKIPWALGSDIGAGPYLSMFDVMRSFVEQNKRQKITGATYKKALYRSTLAGAKILNKDSTLGNFAKGKEANFIVLPSTRLQATDIVDHVLARYLKKYKSQRKDYSKLVEKVYYKGQLMYTQRHA